MHGVLYVCLPRSEARSSLQARKKVCEYLTQEGFDTQLRWSGCGDYFGVGGRWPPVASPLCSPCSAVAGRS